MSGKVIKFNYVCLRGYQKWPEFHYELGLHSIEEKMKWIFLLEKKKPFCWKFELKRVRIHNSTFLTLWENQNNVVLRLKINDLKGHLFFDWNITQGVNFINVLHTNFLYERRFGSFFSSYMYAVKAAKTTFVPKTCAYNVDEIDGRTFTSRFQSWNSVVKMAWIRNINL